MLALRKMSFHVTFDHAAPVEHPLTTEDPPSNANPLNLLPVHPSDQTKPMVLEQDDPNKIPLTDSSLANATETLSLDPSYDGHYDYEEEDEESEILRLTTEANRVIPVIEQDEPVQSNATNGLEPGLLVFSDHVKKSVKSDRIITSMVYGAGKNGVLAPDIKPKRKRRTYLAACDFSDHGYYALEWVMGTMMRDGDELHIATVVNREDNPEAVKAAGFTLAKELQNASLLVTNKAKDMMSQMLLYDIKLTTHAISGRVKDVLGALIRERQLSMVICGSRGRGVAKNLLMGSISTFLVHKSPVPVSVVRPQIKTKKIRKLSIALPLSDSVQTGKLAVDELSKRS
ncbi:hypothetical protein CLU79DRAFT_735164 [Phycomyces nitens]|nr:hypothetical protein CLU79DRAFT_735164 [Phycomyces nitens]